MDVNLRYHYNQGLGWLIRNSEESNTTLEIGVAFDNSDYLNTEQKTSYFRTGMTFDTDFKLFSTKLEVDYYHQLKQVQNTDLSRFQMVGDVQWNFKKSISIVLGFTQDFQTNESFDFKTASIFLTLAFKQPLDWQF